jgi:hypothetical protein
MEFINPIYQTPKVKGFLADLIHDYDYDCYSKLAYSDKCELVSLILEAVGRFDEHEFFVEGNDLDSTMAFFKKALSGSREDDENFLFAIKEHAVKYYEKTMELLFNDALEDYEKARDERMDQVAKYGDPDKAYDTYREQLSC